MYRRFSCQFLTLPAISHFFFVSSYNMSDINGNSNGYLSYLYGEQHAEDLERARRALFVSNVGALVASLAAFDSTDATRLSSKRHAGRLAGATNIKQKGKKLDVDDNLSRMDHRLFRRKYRMNRDSFYNLLDILEPHLPRELSQTHQSLNHKSSRLCMALRYCAG